MMVDGIEYLLRDGIQPDSVKAQLISSDTVVVGYIDAITEEPAVFIGDLNALDLDPNAVLPEYKVSVDFTATEIQPWLLPSENELIVAVLGANDLAYAHAFID